MPDLKCHRSASQCYCECCTESTFPKFTKVPRFQTRKVPILLLVFIRWCFWATLGFTLFGCIFAFFSLSFYLFVQTNYCFIFKRQKVPKMNLARCCFLALADGHPISFGNECIWLILFSVWKEEISARKTAVYTVREKVESIYRQSLKLNGSWFMTHEAL